MSVLQTPAELTHVDVQMCMLGDTAFTNNQLKENSGNILPAKTSKKRNYTTHCLVLSAARKFLIIFEQ